MNFDNTVKAKVSRQVQPVRQTSVESDTPLAHVLTDKPRAPHIARQMACESFVVEGAAWSELCERAATLERAPEDVVLASIAAWLVRYTGQTEFDLPVNRLAVGEASPEWGKEWLKVRAADDPCFGELLKSLQREPSRDEEIEEFGQSLAAASPVCWLSCTTSHMADTAHADMACDCGFWVEVSELQTVVRLLYASTRFEQETASRMLHHLRTLLTVAVSHLETPIHELPLMSDEERRQLVPVETETAPDNGQCLHWLVEKQAAETPEHIAVEHERVQLSYAALNARANALARYLRTVGVPAGSHVGICLPSSADFAIATLGVLKAGCACVPLDPKYPAERLLHMLADAQAKIVLTQPGLLPPSLPVGLKAIELSAVQPRLDQMPSENPDLAISPTDTAYVIYTSGSTGKPRGVVLAHAGLASYVVSAARYYGITARDRILQFCSLSFDIAVEEMFMTWPAGGTLVFRSEQMPLAVPGFLDWIRERRITVLDLPTAYWHEWVSQFDELEAPVPDELRLVIVGGEKALAGAYFKWQRAANRVRWVNTYGPTETSIAVTRYEPDPAEDFDPAGNIPIGRSIENYRLYVLDRFRNPVPAGVPGELYVGGVGVARGYFNLPELTTQKFVRDPFSNNPESRLYSTGDVVRVLRNGLIEYLGREDNQVKIRGFRVELGEIEELLSRHPEVREAVVVAVDDPGRGKSLVAYCSARAGAALDPAGLRAFARQHLPEHMVPAAVVEMEALPKTPNGKVDRRRLAQLELSGPAREGSPEPPSTLRERQLQQIWQETLGRRPVGRHENFFDLGGHSLLAARLMQKVSRLVGKTVPLALLFEAPTIKQLAALLETDEWSQRWSSLVAIQPKGSRPPLFCVHGVGGNVVGFRELGRLLSPGYPLYGFQAPGLDGQRVPLATVEALAAHYIREMRTVQPEGPFFLGGYSFGGIVAYEMAQLLQEGGEQVALLALLDTYPGELKPVATSLWRLLRHPTRLREMKGLPQTAKKSIDRRIKEWFLSDTLKNVLRANQQASQAYILRSYAGKSTLFRAEQSSLRAFDDPHAEWDQLAAGGLETLEISGDHGDILMPPQVADLAAKLKNAIDNACAEQATPESYEEQALA